MLSFPWAKYGRSGIRENFAGWSRANAAAKFLRIPLLGSLVAAFAFAALADDGSSTETAAAGSPPEVRELWVPAEHLDAVLKKFPRAVMLTRDQYAALLADSLPDDDDGETAEDAAAALPFASVLGKVAMSGELHEEVAVIRARYEVQVFVENRWAQIPMALPRQRLAKLSVDGEGVGAVRAIGDDPDALQLLVRGKGRHQVEAEFHLPIERNSNGRAIRLRSPGTAAAQLTLRIEDGIKLDSELPFALRDGVASFALPAADKDFEIRWAAGNVAPIETAAIFQTCRYLYSIDSARVQGDLGLVLSSNLRDLPITFSVGLARDVRLLSVEGSELLRWDRDASGAVSIELVAGKRRATDLRLLVEAPVNLAAEADAAAASISLPSVDVEGVHRASGTLALIGSDDVKVQSVETGRLTVPALDELAAVVREHPNFVSGFRFPVLSDAPQVTLSPVAQRFRAKIDTAVMLRRDAVQLRRELSVTATEGRLFETRIEIPAGEEVSSVRWKSESANDGEALVWERVADADAAGGATALRIEWPGGLAAGDSHEVVIESRRDPEDWFSLGEEPVNLTFVQAEIVDAEPVSGYLAVGFDDSFRVETVDAEGLEARDARATPVKGQLAWFRLREYSLELNVARRAPEFDGRITAYLLPLQNTLEVEGQLALDIRYTPLAELVVRLDPAVAEHLRFDSPLIAEKKLDEASGEWTLSFHQEPLGALRLRFHMSVPHGGGEAALGDGDGGSDGNEDEQSRRFEIDVPVIAVEGVQRLSGQWLVEANTDTELSFEAQGLDEIDLLQAVSIDGYAPRHRLIAAYGFRGADHRLRLSGTRHQAAELITAVVDELEIDSVLSTDGLDRHQAKIQLRTAGEQFLEVGLPEGAELWTLTVDGAAVKPVTSRVGTLRIGLPADAEGRAEVDIRLVYQLRRKRGWRGSGRLQLEPIRLSEKLPVLHSDWRLHLPEGYDYQGFRSNLRKRFEVTDRTLLGQAARSLGRPRYRDAADLDDAAEPMGVQESLVQSVDWDADPGISEAANRYVIRLQERVKQADAAAVRGKELMESGDLSAAMDRFRDALALLPDATLTDHRKDLYVELYSQASVALARRRAEDGNFADAFSLLDSVLADDVAPDHAEAKQLRRELMDPEIYPGAMTPELREKRRQVELALKNAQGAMDLGVYDDAQDYYRQALANDPYNEAARRGLEKVERSKMEYYATARDHSRARFVREIEAGWELPVPMELELRQSDESASEPTLASDGNTGVALMENKLKSIILPSVEFVDTPLRDALEFLTMKSRELDAGSGDPAQRGLNVILSTGHQGADAAPPPSAGGFGFDDPSDAASDAFGADVGSTRITLKLQNVPLIEALRYTTSLANLKFKIEPHAVLIVPLSAPDADLYTNVYRVPPTFLSSGAGDHEGGPVDPFASPAGGGGTLEMRPDARTILERAGVTFGEGATAIYDPATSRLIVRNTQDQMELVEAYQDSIKAAPSDFPEPNYLPAPEGSDLAASDIRAFRGLFDEGGERAFRSSVNGGNERTQQGLQLLVVEVPPNFLRDPINGQRVGARDLLESVGVMFPAGGGAAFNPATGRLAVKTSADQMELVEAFFDSKNYAVADSVGATRRSSRGLARSRGEGVVGLIPIDFELPEAGRVYRFDGLYAPEEMRFRYVDWERQVRVAWWWILFGGLAFVFVALRWGRPWFGGLLGIVALVFVPLSLLPSLMAMCNSVLIGWAAAMALLAAWRVADAARSWQRREAMRARAVLDAEKTSKPGEVAT